MMRLVDHDKRAPLLVRAILEQAIGEPQTQGLFPVAVMGQAEIVEDRLQQSGAVGEMAVGQKGAGGLFVKAVEENVAEQRLAAAGLSSQEHETFIAR